MLVDTLAPPTGPWTRVDVVALVGSTNAVSLVEPVPWRLVVAEAQEAGRGRHARVWVSPPGTSVAMSLTVPLPERVADWGWIPLVTGLAVRDGLVRLSQEAGDPLEVVLKWPNDVLVRPRSARAGDADDVSTGGEEFRKVCGILCEGGDGVVVAGVGVNVTVPAEELPVPTATSLHLAGLSVSREDVVVGVAEAFADRYSTFLAGADALDGLRRDYREACSTLGAEVRIHLPGAPGTPRDVRGRAVDLDLAGCLVLDVDGVRRTFAAGDVVHVRPAERA
ncbi:biotin protein ligase [Mobilicoccus pelagius NBRC 104925]|uniref:biotin--[biotin carboxyl-carrier protein] ligase n=1 Tax=Mobilicoccus pelagius NBRC 104925 TaxID=1089455 RepID=H5UN26_9MICO|nr:biotin protein ligase [Mobilicoccus pelagius NBRC 104925]